MTLEKRVEELRSLYSNVDMKTLQDSITAVRIKNAQLPSGCTPDKTDVLLLFPPNQDTPSKRYVKENVKLPNGKAPKNLNPTQVDGETWYDFSYNFPWSPQTDTMYQYVESALHRFAKTE